MEEAAWGSKKQLRVLNSRFSCSSYTTRKQGVLVSHVTSTQMRLLAGHYPLIVAQVAPIILLGPFSFLLYERDMSPGSMQTMYLSSFPRFSQHFLLCTVST